MVYLESFRLSDRCAEESYFSLPIAKNMRTCYTTKYPFNIFRYRQLSELHFAPLTVFYGGNGNWI